MRILKSIGLILSALVIIVLIFSLTSPMFKAKTSLRILGIDDKYNSEFNETRDIILENEFEKYESLTQLDSRFINYLKNYHLKQGIHKTEKPNKIDLKEIYAEDDEDWNATDNIRGGLPFSKFEYAYGSKNAFILGTQIGGLGSSYLIEVFRIEDESIILVNTINIYSSDIFSGALSIKFDKNLSDYGNLMNNTKSIIESRE